MIREHDMVVLTTPLAAEGLETGDVGAVVHVYPRQEAYEIEFEMVIGQTVPVVTVLAGQVRLLTSGENPHARNVSHR